MRGSNPPPASTSGKASRTGTLKARVDHTALLQQLFAGDAAFHSLHSDVAQMLQVPASFAGLRDILTSLREMGTLFGTAPLQMLPAFRLVLDWVAKFDATNQTGALWDIEVVSSYGKRAQARGSTGDTARFPYFQGIHDSNPTWCALFFMSGTALSAPQSHDRAKAYRALQFWFLGAYMQLQAGGPLIPLIRSRVEEAGRLLRVIHQPDLGEEIDWFSRVDLRDVPKAHSRLASRHRLAPDKGLRQGFGAFADLLSYGWDLGFPSVFQLPTGLRGARTGKKGRWRIEYDLIFPDHRHYLYLLAQETWLEEQDPCRASVQVVSPGADLAEDLHNSGVAPEEFAADTVMQIRLSDLVPRDAAPKDLPPLASLYAAARNRARVQMMEDQRFTTRLDRITTADLARVLTVLDQLFALTNHQGSPGGTAARSDKTSLRQIVLLLATSLVTGTPPDEVRTLTVETSTPLALPEGIHLMYAEHELSWLRRYRPPDRDPLPVSGSVKAVGMQQHISLTDVWSVGRHLLPAQEKERFPSSADAVRSLFSTYVKPALLAAGVPKRWCRVESFSEIMPGWFSGLEEGDHLRAAAIFDRSDRLAETHRYYTAIQRGELADYYAEQLKTIWAETTQNGFRSQSDLFQLRSVRSSGQGYVGDDRVQALGTLRTLATKLREQLGVPAKKSLAALVEHHNAKSAYLAFTLAMVTGCRAVRTPIPDLRLVDRKTGFLSLQEKDRKDGSHARLVWLPPRVQELIDDYLAHLQELWLEPTFRGSSNLKVAATKHRDRCRFDSAAFSLSLLHTVWFFDTTEASQPEPVEWTGAALRLLALVKN